MDDFAGATFYGNAAFGGARVEGAADFRGAEFLGGFWAEGLALAGPADLADTQVHGRLRLKRARPGNAPLPPASFAPAYGYAWT